MAGFALRALGMVFRVFVAARLGPEGMGLYQLILSVYMVFVSLASAGINVASTRLGAQCLTRGRGMAPTLRSLAATAAVLGTAAMLDGLIDRINAELNTPCTVVATGGLSSVIAPLCRNKIILDDDLLLKGLSILFEKNKPKN